MNKTEALEALKAGKAIRHRAFLQEEFIIRINGVIIDESGLQLDENLFWKDRQAGFFDEDWSVIEPTPDTTNLKIR